jgi:hypothetical protein
MSEVHGIQQFASHKRLEDPNYLTFRRYSDCHSFTWPLGFSFVMTHPLLASPTGALPYPSSTPYPSRTNTPIFTASISSHSSSSGSYGHKSQSSWKAPWKSSSVRKTPRRAQTAPWKGSDPMAYYGYYQQQAPGWGNTAEYQPLPPPMPTYQPTSNCE